MSEPVTCLVCGRGRPIELQMKARNGQLLTMLSCPRCETRSWYADGAPISMQEVLRITANDPEFVVMPVPSRTPSAQDRD